MKKGNTKLTLSVKEEITQLYKEFCNKEGLVLSKQIELFMSNELKKRGKLK